MPKKEESLLETGKKMMVFMDMIIDQTDLSKEDKIILLGYYAGLIDAELAEELHLKNKTAVRNKRQNICAKIGHTLISYRKFINDDRFHALLKKEDRGGK